jgi:diadenosine tetraphosphate (Ap4A) HIT family hydrolase
MTFEALRNFLASKMKMSHIYQPLLIKTLIESGGVSTIRQLSTAFLSNDESQIMFYEKRLKEMPIKVLSKHGIISRDGELVSLNVKKLTLEQKAEIKKLCEQKIQEYIASRGLKIWDYSLLDDTLTDDKLRFRLLREAKGRCALCGATKDDRPLDIDHIIPRSKGGKTEYENLQVLCSKCNRTKRDRDDGDYRKGVEVEYREGCVFCEKSQSDEIILENDYAYAVLDGYPVSVGHTLIIPKRHFADYFDITEKEYIAVRDLIRVRRKQLLEQDKTIEGFNVGANSGEVAGQTIWHCHIHLIPRRRGDTTNPRGGVRGVIPDRMGY